MMSLLSRSTSRPLLRALLLLIGAVALLGGAAWSAAAVGFGADDDTRTVEAAPAAEPPADVKLTGEGLLAWLDAVGALEGLDKVAENAPFGAKRFFESKVGMDFLPFVRDKIESAVGSGISLTELDAKLDDLDGDGDPASDFHDIAGVTVDLDVDLVARTTPGSYDVTIALKANAAEDSPLAMSLDGLKINGSRAADALKLDLGTTLRLDPTATPAAKKVVVLADQAAVGTVRLGVDGTYDGAANPLAFQVGVLGVKATGTVTADAGVRVTLEDPNDDGVVDLGELASPASLFQAACVSSGAQVDLTVTGDLAGISGKVGRIRIADDSLCNGLAAPDVELGDLAQFRSVTLGDVVNGLAQVTQALKSAQAAGDVPVPFVQEPLRDLVAVNERLVAFFVDNGFTDPAHPMASISVDTAETAAVKTLQDLAPRLATALGMSPDSLALRYDAGKVLLTVTTSGDPAARPATVDLGEVLGSVGVTEVTGTATASVDPAYSVDLGVGFDLAAGKPLDQRFFLTNGADGNVATLDAAVSADLDISAAASVLGLRLTDARADGPVPLLQRKDAAKPMLSVGLTDPDKDGRTTLAELSAAAALPVRATVNASVPSTTLSAEANAVGIPLGAGTITLAWPNVPDATGAGALSVTADQTFLDTALPFTFDTEDPRALISEVLTVTRETITRMRSAVADGNATTTKPLPLVGKSVADLDPVLMKVQTAVDRLIQANDLLTLPALQAKLDEVLAEELGGAEGEVPNIVDLVYEPRTATSPATVLVELRLGACSTDRAEGREGCTVTGAPVDVPFNLDLGTGSRVGGVAGVGANGTVKVGYDARANLTFGVQLPTVSAGAKPTDLPTVSGAPKLFVQDDAALDLGIGAKVDGVISAGLGPVQVSLGQAGGPQAQAAVAARFKVAAPSPTGKRLVVGSSEFSTWVASLLPKAGSVTVHETDEALKATCEGVSTAVDACAALPVYAGSTPLGTVRFSAPDLLTPSAWTVDATEVEANLQNEAIQFSLLVDGVRTLTTQISEGLRSLPTGTRIPLVGADVTAGADVLESFDEHVLTRVQSLSTAVASAATSGAVKTKAEEVLAGIPGLPAGQSPSVTVTCRSADGATVGACAGTEPVARLQSLEVGLPLSYTKTTSSGAFDIGFPGLRLASDDEIRGSAGLAVQLGFGVDRDLGFYVPTTATNRPEFAVTASAALPAKVTGDLAFLPVEIVDQHAGDDVTVAAGLDLSTTRPDGRLPFADLGRARLTPVLDAQANLDLGLRTMKPEGALSALPTFKADLVIGAGVTWSGAPGAQPTTNASIRFEDVAVDAGTLVSDLIKPVAKTLHTYTEPLEKPIEAIRKPIPGVAEAAKLAGKTAPSWYDAFKAADQASNGGKGSSGVQMIDRVIALVDLVKQLNKADAPAGMIPLGSFTVLPGVASEPVPLNDADQLIGTSSVTTSNVISKLDIKDVDLGTAKTQGGFSFPAFEKPSSLFGMLLGKDVALVYFDAGKLEVKRGFQFSYPIGPARLYIGGSAGVSGHLAAGFDTYGLRKAFELVTDDDPTNDGAWSITKGLLQGLYLDDFDQSGKDVPEIKFTASLSAGASVGIPGLEAGAEGGVEGTAEFNLRTDSAGKLRYTHIAEQLRINKNPLCFFDASARVDAYIKAFVDTPFGKADYPIVNKRIYEQPDLFSFCRTPQPEEQQNLLAELREDGTLALKTDAAPQSITVTQQGAGEVEVAAQGIVEVYSGVTRIFADLKGGDDVMDVRYAVPDDTAPALPASICGGAGNDRVMVDRAPATLYGDGSASCPGAGTGGDDSLTTGRAVDTVDGGPGSDMIDTGDGADTIAGGAGDDVLRGGLGSDTMDGGSGDDTSDYGDHTQPVTVNLPFPSGQEGEQDRADDVENVYGGSAGDTLNLPGGTSVRADGGGGDDTVVTTDGTALVMGGEGADEFVGGTGAAQFVGSTGDDVLIDGPGAQTFLGLEGRDTVDYSAVGGPVRVVLDGEPGDGPIAGATDNMVDVDVVVATSYDDQLTGGSASEELRGGAGADEIEGGPGADLLLGQGGDDTLVGNAGADRLEGDGGVDLLRGGTDADVLLGGDGDDDLDGQEGDDRLDAGADADRVRGGEGGDDLHGGAGFDWVDYSDRTDDLRVTIDDVAYDGAGFGSEKDNLHTDVEKYVGGSGRDEVHGSTHDQVFLGNAGDDYLAGMGGADRFEGGAGHDRLFDLEFNRRGLEAGDGGLVDTFVGGDGNDEAIGNGGRDVYDMGAGDDDVDAGADVDTVHLGDGHDDVYAGAGADVVYGDGGDDLLRGEDGDDQLDSGASEKGNGAIWGGLGSDTIWNGQGGGAVTTGSGGGTADDAGATNTVYGYASPAGGHNSYTGSLGTDVFHLGDGNDLVYPGGGDDVVELGGGWNTSYASDGNDTITGGDGEDQINGGPGDDALAGGGADDNLYGGAGNDVLRAGEGIDGLQGGDGDDVLDGGLGADDLYGEAGFDTVSYADRTTDVVVSEDGNFNDGGVEDASPGVTYRDMVRDDNERIVTGSGDDHVWLADRDRTVAATIEGGAGDDVLEVRSLVTADVTLVGGPGDDQLLGGPGDDTFDQGDAPDGADDMTGGAGADRVDYSGRAAGKARVSFDGTADDGERGEGDNARADVESAPGAVLGGQPAVQVTVGAVKVLEGAAGAKRAATVTVTTSEAVPTPTTIPWSVAGGTATLGRDVQAGSGTVTVPAGQTTATFAVTVLGDALDEADETATVTVGEAKATLTVVDDDAAPRLTVRPATVVEGKSGTRTMTFQVVLSAASGRTVSVRLATANGTARAGSDYLAKAQVVTFAPGQTTRTFTVAVKGDKAKEKNETFTVVGFAPVNVSLGSPALGTIRNDDKR